jgi:hypothetical protein
MTCEILKMGREEVKSCFPFFFSFFFFKFLLFIFEIFHFIKCKCEKNQICSGKGENKMMDLGVREKIK